jgi:superfamily II DNA/RNA helicase
MTTLSPSFASLGVPAPVVNALAELGAVEPFPIQALTLPDSLAGRDLLGRGKTGSGKTIAFAIPLVAVLSADRRRSRPMMPRGIVLVPTRELADQVAATIRPLAESQRLRTAVVYGGVGFGHQIEALRRGVDIVVACPGRLEDLVKQGRCRLDAVEVTVLDEADHMTDMGFLPVVRRLLDATPSNGQRLLFSATLDNDVAAIVDRYLSDPARHELDTAGVPIPAMEHHLLAVAAPDKLAVVTRLAAGAERVLLFTRTKHGAKRLVRQLGQAGLPAVELHGNLSQAARQRNLAEFAAGRTTVLVATDIAARGLHVDEIALVVHVDPPAEHKAFVHRSGRTARAGATGTVVTLMTPDQTREVRAMMRAAGVRPIETTGVTESHPLLGDLAGPADVTPRRAAHTTGRTTTAPAQRRQESSPRAARSADAEQRAKPVARSRRRATTSAAPSGRTSSHDPARDRQPAVPGSRSPKEERRADPAGPSRRRRRRSAGANAGRAGALGPGRQRSGGGRRRNAR